MTIILWITVALRNSTAFDVKWTPGCCATSNFFTSRMAALKMGERGKNDSYGEILVDILV
jgi:hypothetical protein